MIANSNSGPLIDFNNYWGGPLDQQEEFFLSFSPGMAALLIPTAFPEAHITFDTANMVVISRGPWPDAELDDAIEILFEDGSYDPFAFHIPTTSCNLQWPPADQTLDFTAWHAGRRGIPRMMVERPCGFRVVDQLPSLKPWSTTGEH